MGQSSVYMCRRREIGFSFFFFAFIYVCASVWCACLCVQCLWGMGMSASAAAYVCMCLYRGLRGAGALLDCFLLYPLEQDLSSEPGARLQRLIQADSLLWGHPTSTFQVLEFQAGTDHNHLALTWLLGTQKTVLTMAQWQVLYQWNPLVPRG